MARPSPASSPSDAQREFQLDPAKAGAGISPARCWPKAAAASPAPSSSPSAASSPTSPPVSASASSARSSAGSSRSSPAASALVLIAKDIWEFRNGVLPIVATEMKSKSTKDLVETELAKSISDQINEHTREIAAATADRIIEIWREFRRGHAKVVELAERNERVPRLRRYLEAGRSRPPRRGRRAAAGEPKARPAIASGLPTARWSTPSPSCRRRDGDRSRDEVAGAGLAVVGQGRRWAEPGDRARPAPAGVPGRFHAGQLEAPARPRRSQRNHPPGRDPKGRARDHAGVARSRS